MKVTQCEVNVQTVSLNRRTILEFILQIRLLKTEQPPRTILSNLEAAQSGVKDSPSITDIHSLPPTRERAPDIQR